MKIGVGKEIISEILTLSIKRVKVDNVLDITDLPPIIVERARDEKFGDFSTNLAMTIAHIERKKPRLIADIIVENIHKSLKSEDKMLSFPSSYIDKVEIAGPGFINFFMSRRFWLDSIKIVEAQGSEYGASSLGNNRRIQIEFVSANPTGPLHIGHGRGAAVGDILANIMKKAGYNVEKEYYINDVGTQMTILGKSTFIRYQQLLGRDIPFPEDGYKGDYINHIAKDIITRKGEYFMDQPEEVSLPFFTEFASRIILDGIKKDLEDFGVKFDNWFSEKTLYDRGEVDEGIGWLKEKGLAYEKDNAVWLKSGMFGDEKDRVLVRGNGQHTYFASDIAYHRDKFKRGFDRVIDIWGADHHGYVPRMKAIIEAMGYHKDALNPILVQLVNLKRGNEQIAMSTREGKFTTLSEVVREVGKDAARFFFLMRSSDSHLDFDLDLARKESKENPVYYVQYAHARISSIFRVAGEKGIDIPTAEEVDIDLLKSPEEMTLIKEISKFPEVVEKCAIYLEPHRLTYYLQDLASIFHNCYNKYRVISEDRSLTDARLILAKSIGIVLKNALLLLGISAPEKM
ncbi:MAG: arginine--tRNA ligase [Nitrospinota bacterium]